MKRINFNTTVHVFLKDGQVWKSLQLWDLITQYHEEIGIGQDPPFEDNCFYIKQEDIE